MPQPDVRHEYVDAGGVRTHVALAGPDDAPPVLLVHGWPQSWWAWRHVIPALSDRFRVIAPDLRGHGWSDAPAGGYDKEQLASDVLALLDALGIERATWVGHDWGGWSGFLAALRAPTRIERLLSLCVPHPWLDLGPAQLGALLGYQVPISLPLVGRRVARPVSRRLLQVGRGGDRLGAADVARFAGEIPPRVTVAMYRTNLLREALPIVRGRYDGKVLAMPATLMVGARDVITKSAAPGPVPGQPNLTVEVLDGVAHWVPEQRPQPVVDWVRRG